MKVRPWIFLLLFLGGLFILLLPDSGNRVFQFNRAHGPSPMDIVGLTLILLGWIYSCVLIVNKWNKIMRKVGKQIVSILVIIYLISAAGIAASLLLSSDLLLWSSAITATAVNILFIVFALRPDDG
jgi:hypothetical protein